MTEEVNKFDALDYTVSKLGQPTFACMDAGVHWWRHDEMLVIIRGHEGSNQMLESTGADGKGVFIMQMKRDSRGWNLGEPDPEYGPEARMLINAFAEARAEGMR